MLASHDVAEGTDRHRSLTAISKAVVKSAMDMVSSHPAANLTDLPQIFASGIALILILVSKQDTEMGLALLNNALRALQRTIAQAGNHFTYEIDETVKPTETKP